MFEVEMSYAQFSGMPMDKRLAYLGVLSAHYQEIISAAHRALAEIPPLYEIDQPEGLRRQLVQFSGGGDIPERKQVLDSNSRLVDLLDEASRFEPDPTLRRTVKRLYKEAQSYGQTLQT